MTTPCRDLPESASCKGCVKGYCDRWDHLVELVRSQRTQATTVVTGDAILMSDDEVERCACGGVFAPEKGGRMICGCCGAPQPLASTSTAEGEVCRTLREHLVERRRRKVTPDSGEWTPSDDDVKVTTYG